MAAWHSSNCFLNPVTFTFDNHIFPNLWDININPFRGRIRQAQRQQKNGKNHFYFTSLRILSKKYSLNVVFIQLFSFCVLSSFVNLVVGVCVWWCFTKKIFFRLGSERERESSADRCYCTGRTIARSYWWW